VISILIADDQALVASGFRAILDAQPDMEVVAEAADGRQAVDVARRLQPDVALLDVRMPVLDGLEATGRIVGAQLRTRVVILTTFDLDEYVWQAVRAGASGFLLKDLRREQLVVGVRAAAAGETIVAPAIARRLVEQFSAVSRSLVRLDLQPSSRSAIESSTCCASLLAAYPMPRSRRSWS
jgi:DNA-binding NarL/FixJ family response regulator